MVALVYVGLGTQPGARWVVDHIDRLLPGSLTVAQVEGPVRGPLTLRGVTWNNGRTTVEVDRVHLDWDLRQIVHKLIDIHSLQARGVTVTLAPSPTPGRGQLQDIDLRFNMIIRHARVTDIRVVRPPPAPPLVIDSIAFDTAQVGAAVKITNFHMLSPHIDATVSGSLRPQGDYPVDLQIAWKYRPPNHAAVSGHGSLGGTLVALAIDQQIAAPFRGHVQGVLHDPLFDLRLDLTAHVEGLDPQQFTAKVPVPMTLAGDARLQGPLHDLASTGDATRTHQGIWTDRRRATGCSSARACCTSTGWC